MNSEMRAAWNLSCHYSTVIALCKSSEYSTEIVS